MTDLLGVLVARVDETGHGRGILRLAHEDLASSIFLLALSLSRVCSSADISASFYPSSIKEDVNVPVEFSVKLSSPIREHTAILGFFPDTVIEFRETSAHLDEWELTTNVISLTDSSSSS